MPKFVITVREQRAYSISIEAVDESDAVMQAIWTVEAAVPPMEPDDISIDAEDCHAELQSEAA